MPNNFDEFENLLPKVRPGFRRLGVFLFALVLLLGATSIGTRWLTSGSAAEAAQAGELGDKGRPIASAEELAKADALLRDQMASGWVPYSSESALDGTAVSGWIRMGISPSGHGPDLALMRSEAPLSGDGMAVYHEPNGARIGFDYTSLGFVPTEIVDAGFDSSNARTMRYGCDPVMGPNAQTCFESLESGQRKSAGTDGAAATN